MSASSPGAARAASRTPLPLTAEASPRTLTQIVAERCEARGLQRETFHSYNTAVRAHSAFLGHVATVDDLEHERIEAWGANIGEAFKQWGHSLRNRKSMLRSVWRFAFERGYVGHSPDDAAKFCGFTRADVMAATAANGDAPAGIRPLADVVRQYRAESDASPNYLDELEYSALFLARCLGRLPVLADLNDAVLNQFVVWYAAQGVAVPTVRNRRRQLLTLWRYGYQCGWLECLPRRIRKLKAERYEPRAWTEAEFAQVLDAAGRVQGDVRNHWPCTWAQLLRAFCLLAVNSALRYMDVLRAAWGNLDGDVLTVVQHKTGNPICIRLWPATMQAIEQARHGHELLIGGRVTATNLARRFQSLCRRIRVPGSVRWARKSAATWAEARQRGTAKYLLGHRSDGLADKFYVDSRQVAKVPVCLPMPTALMAPNGIVPPPATTTPEAADTAAPVAVEVVLPAGAAGVASLPAVSLPWGTVDVNTWSPDAAGKDGVA